MQPTRYRLIVQSVEAMSVLPETLVDVAMWCGGLTREEIDPVDSKKKFVGINIPTLMGVLRASQGDFIVKDHNGIFDRMPANEFHSKYEPA